MKEQILARFMLVLVHARKLPVVFALAAMLMLVLAPAAFAAPPFQTSSPVTDPGALVQQLASLAGVMALITFLVNASKTFGWVPDGEAGTVQGGLSLLAMVGLWVLDVFRPNLVTQVDSVAAILAQLGAYLITLVGAVLFGKLVHFAVRGLPLIGYSHTVEDARKLARFAQR